LKFKIKNLKVLIYLNELLKKYLYNILIIKYSVECEDQPATLYCEQCLDNYCEVSCYILIFYIIKHYNVHFNLLYYCNYYVSFILIIFLLLSFFIYIGLLSK